MGSCRSLCILQYAVYNRYGIYLHTPGNCIVVLDLRGLHPVSDEKPRCASTERSCLLHEDTVLQRACVIWCLWLEQSSGTDCLCPRIHSFFFFLVFIAFNFPSPISLFILETVLVKSLPLWLKSYSLTYILSLFHLKLFSLSRCLTPCQLAGYLPSGVYWPVPRFPLYLSIHSSLHPASLCQSSPVAVLWLDSRTTVCGSGCFSKLAFVQL